MMTHGALIPLHLQWRIWTQQDTGLWLVTLTLQEVFCLISQCESYQRLLLTAAGPIPGAGLAAGLVGGISRSIGIPCQLHLLLWGLENPTTKPIGAGLRYEPEFTLW